MSGEGRGVLQRVGQRARAWRGGERRPPSFGARFKRAEPLRKAYDLVSVPLVAAFLLDNARIRPEHGLNWWRKLRLVWRFYQNTKRIETGLSYRAHAAMAAKLLEIPPQVEGVVVECGAYKGGTTANLSIVCDLVGRDLIVYDSFEGLPPPAPGEKIGTAQSAGWFRGELEEVRENVRRHGVLQRCTFRKGWFADTLPRHTEPVVMCLLDVDYQASLYDCVTNLWDHVVDKGLVFIDEYTSTDYCALFFSERFWRERFDTTPPGLVGVGTGIALGHFWVGPLTGTFGADFALPLQTASSIAYAQKGLSGYWDYYPEDIAPTES